MGAGEYKHSKRQRTDEECSTSGRSPDHHFLQDDYECSICLSLLVDPVVGQCGHDYCKSCLEEWKESSSCGQGVNCPVCRQILMAPGVQSLGVCIRLKNTIERLFPERVAQRRREIQQQAHARQQLKQQEMVEQMQTVQQMMRMRFAAFLAMANTRSQQGPVGMQRILSGSPHPAAPAQDMTREASHSQASSLNGASVQPVPRRTPRTTPSPAAPAPHRAPVRQDSYATLALQRFDASSSPASPASPGAGSGQNWHCPATDLPLRQATARELVRMFHIRRPDMETSFRTRLPMFVRKLEEGLYRNARSREEYADAATLEARVQNLARRLLEQQVATAVAETVETEAAALWEQPQVQQAQPVGVDPRPVSAVPCPHRSASSSGAGAAQRRRASAMA